MIWKQYGERKFEHLNKEFWDAYEDGVSAHVLKLGDKWCAYAQAPSKYGNPAINHGDRTDFVFADKEEAMRKAEQLAKAARISLEKERR